MIFKKTQGIFLIIFFLTHFYLYNCTMILVGKNATKDDSVLLAHNNDLPGNIGALIQIIPEAFHSQEEMITLKNGVKIPYADHSLRLLMINCYYGFSEGDAKAINQCQVAVAGGTSLKNDRSDLARKLDPLIEEGVTGYIRYIALQRSKTARECVEYIGKMYSQYGIAYPSSVGVADTKEVWYMEAGGGKCWVAQRIPDDHYLVAVNGYRIGDVDFNDKENFIYSTALPAFAIKNKLWKPGKSLFNFAKTFGRRYEKLNNYFNSRRVWRVQTLLTPSYNQSPEVFHHPLTLPPLQRISVPQLIQILRDFYQGTSFDISKTKTASLPQKERAIGVFNTVHTSVIQLRDNYPADIGAVLWGGLSSALTTPYVPYYFGIKNIPTAFKKSGPNYDKSSAFWQFRRLTTLLEPRFNILKKMILPELSNFEKKLFLLQQDIEKTAINIYKRNNEQAKEFLTLYSNGLSLKALAMIDLWINKLETHISEKLNK